jgi:hypothetical protein
VVDRPETGATDAGADDSRLVIAVDDPDDGTRDVVLLEEPGQDRLEVHRAVLLR